MPTICGVRFRGTGKVYFFDPRDLALAVDDYVIVNTSRGDELAQVAAANRLADDSEVVGELKPVLRRATSLDLLEAERYRTQEPEAIERCQQQVDQSRLEMKVVGAEYSYDGARLTFFFTSEKRVDFRNLVRELARTFKARIELRQIGVRDEAKLVGGLGPCGRPLCCATWLTQFTPVSIRMAKQQNLPLSPMEISGLCGRLLCCLTYEDDYYREIKGRFPRVGRTVETSYGPAKVIKVCVFTEKVTLLLEDGAKIELTADQLAGNEPLPPRAERSVRREALDATLRAQESAAPREQRRQAAPDRQPNQREDRSPEPQRRNSRPERDGPQRRQPPAAAQSAGEQGPSTGAGRQDSPPGEGEAQRPRKRRPRGARRNSSRGGNSGGEGA
jgi:cell fate regulator YaaT (PSP1 superfamily)